jgi:hypothetical protein
MEPATHEGQQGVRTMRYTHRVICAGLMGALLVATPALAAPRRADRAPRESGYASKIERPSTLRGLRVSVDGRDRQVASVRLLGLKRLDEAAVWQSLGGHPAGELGEEQVGQLLGALDRTGLFASVTPTLNLTSPEGPEGTVTLDIQL